MYNSFKTSLSESFKHFINVFLSILKMEWTRLVLEERCDEVRFRVEGIEK